MKFFKKNLKKNKGFSLVELMVASSVFLVAFLISAGAIFSVFDANQKSKNNRSAMDNINLSLESMSRTIRFGKTYHCGTPSLLSPLDCSGSGQTSLSIVDVNGVQTIYDLSGGRIRRTSGGNVDYLTSADINISILRFRVYGSPNFSTGDRLQPRVVIVVSGSIGPKANTKTTFTIQTSVSQREIDFQ